MFGCLALKYLEVGERMFTALMANDLLVGLASLWRWGVRPRQCLQTVLPTKQPCTLSRSDGAGVGPAPRGSLCALEQP